MAQTTVRHYSSNRVTSARYNTPAIYSNMQRVYALYAEMARLNKATGCLPVFTTNYDMLIEDLCDEFGKPNSQRPLANGLPNVREEGETWVPISCEGPCNRCSVLQFFRLHGCACWFYHQAGDPNIYYHRADASAQSIRNLCAMYPGLERERGAGPHGHGFRSFYRLLQVCDLLVFIGFSFRDDDVMHVVLKALAERRERLKLLVIDNAYTKHNVIGRLEEAARRSTFPAYVPKDDGITALKLDFGLHAKFDKTILNECKKLIIKE